MPRQDIRVVCEGQQWIRLRRRSPDLPHPTRQEPRSWVRRVRDAENGNPKLGARAEATPRWMRPTLADPYQTCRHASHTRRQHKLYWTNDICELFVVKFVHNSLQ